MVKLSILIATLPQRWGNGEPNVIKQLKEQINEDIELICFMDNKMRNIGLKRQNLLDLSKGEYICFIDDDDRIGDDYIISIIDKIDNERPDLILFNEMVNDQLFEFDLNGYYSVGERDKYGKTKLAPSHLHVYRSEIAKNEKFVNCRYFEDKYWSKSLVPYIKKISNIPKVLYYYNYNPSKSETRMHKHSSVRFKIPNQPKYSVLISNIDMSKALEVFKKVQTDNVEILALSNSLFPQQLDNLKKISAGKVIIVDDVNKEILFK